MSEPKVTHYGQVDKKFFIFYSDGTKKVSSTNPKPDGSPIGGGVINLPLHQQARAAAQKVYRAVLSGMTSTPNYKNVLQQYEQQLPPSAVEYIEPTQQPVTDPMQGMTSSVMDQMVVPPMPEIPSQEIPSQFGDM